MQQPQGVQVHSTGANNPWLRRYVGPDDGQLGRNQYGNHSNQPGGSVCASAYIGRLASGEVAVYQVLPWEYRCWLSGGGSNGNANRLGYIGFEICEDGLADESYFREAMRAAQLLTAHLCELIGRMPDEAGPCGLTVMDHAELHAAGYASNHGDIRHWLKRYGLSMDDWRREVREIMLEGIDVTYKDTKAADVPVLRPMLRMGAVGEGVRSMQQLLIECGAAIEADGIFGNGTRSALIAFQGAAGIAADGICGPVTWAALEEHRKPRTEVPVIEVPEQAARADPALCELLQELRGTMAEAEALHDRMGRMIEEIEKKLMEDDD